MVIKCSFLFNRHDQVDCTLSFFVSLLHVCYSHPTVFVIIKFHLFSLCVLSSDYSAKPCLNSKRSSNILLFVCFFRHSFVFLYHTHTHTHCFLITLFFIHKHLFLSACIFLLFVYFGFFLYVLIVHS